MRLAWLDLLVILAYLAVAVGVGARFTRRERTTRDYFRGGGRVPWWAAGLSLYGTGLSAITFIAIPAMAYRTNWAYLVGMVAGVAAVPFVTRWFIPVYRELDLTTAYEYLEKRFNRPVRLLGSAIFIVFHLGRTAIVLVLPALVLSEAVGLPLALSIVIIGAFAVAYTLLGGIEAVIWTDVMQVIVLIGGALAATIIAIASLDGGVAEFFRVAREHDKLALWNPGFDPTAGAAVMWVIFLGYGMSQFNAYVADQSLVQRYMTTRDARDANRALWLAAVGGVPVQLLFYAVGTAMFVYYTAHPDLLPAVDHDDAIVPVFLIAQLPIGLTGLVIAGVFAAGMSTIDSSMNSIATAVVTDFYAPCAPRADDRRRMRIARWATLTVGVAGIAGAGLVAAMDLPGLLNAFLGWLFLVVGVLAGMFTLGIITTRATAAGALAGAGVATAAVVSAALWSPVSGFLNSVIGWGVCIAAGYVVSLLTPGADRDLAGLTIHTRRRKGAS
ncbi:MAG: sodium:solute symporter [Phycisphaeraceae bacterium]